MKTFILMYVTVAMIYYLLTVIVFNSSKIENSIIGIYTLHSSDGEEYSLNQLKDSMLNDVGGSLVKYQLAIHLSGLIGGFGLPFNILKSISNRIRGAK